MATNLLLALAIGYAVVAIAFGVVTFYVGEFSFAMTLSVPIAAWHATLIISGFALLVVLAIQEHR